MEITCRAFILLKNKLLLCKQRVPKRDFWTLPGGSVQIGETLSECVSREIYEEIGLELEANQILFIRELIAYPRHRIEFYFSIKELNDVRLLDSISPHNEVEDLRFFSMEELKKIIAKPECLPELIGMLNDKQITFPRYLGNTA